MYNLCLNVFCFFKNLFFQEFLAVASEVINNVKEVRHSKLYFQCLKPGFKGSNITQSDMRLETLLFPKHECKKTYLFGQGQRNEKDVQQVHFFCCNIMPWHSISRIFGDDQQHNCYLMCISESSINRLSRLLSFASSMQIDLY